jgi:hypothetical protein
MRKLLKNLHVLRHFLFEQKVPSPKGIPEISRASAAPSGHSYWGS